MEDVVTGEAVVLEVPCARFPSRMVVLAIDIAVQLIILVILLVAVGAAEASGSLDAAAAAAIGLSGTVLIIVGYPTILETVSRAGPSASSPWACAWWGTTAARSGSARRWCARSRRCWRSGCCWARRR